MPVLLSNVSTCDEPLGVSRGDAVLKSNSAEYGGSPDKGALDKASSSPGAWCTHIGSLEGYLQVDLPAINLVTGVATQGAPNGWKVLEYVLTFSLDETEWWQYMEDSKIKHFSGNNGSSLHAVRTNLTAPVRARLVRFWPWRSEGNPCMRVEVYGCSACSDKFGVEDGRIPDLNMSSSSARGPGFEAYRGRLNNLNGNGSWCANMSLPNNQQYLRIDLGEVREVSAVETQGNPFPDVYHLDTIREVNCSSENVTGSLPSADNSSLCNVTERHYRGAWVKRYYLDYSLDGIEWKHYRESRAQTVRTSVTLFFGPFPIPNFPHII
ncbi:neuropilin-2-like [Nematostella vectensis]|uniref:neuropilin-2-like n=1 Tax=Nematostella vectensis TaxID=45351 RepID=UPI0020777CEA|nr:neuropilin-2-like [Nematostella vectensis]